MSQRVPPSKAQARRMDASLIAAAFVTVAIATLLFWLAWRTQDQAQESQPASLSPTPTLTSTQTATLTPSPTDSPTPTDTPTRAATETATPTNTPTFTPSFTPSPTATATFTPSFTPSPYPDPQVQPIVLAETYAGERIFISGGALPGDRIILLNNGQAIAQTQADSNGDWEIDLAGGLEAGEHLLAIYAQGPSGAQSAVLPIGFVVNRAPTASPTQTPSPSFTPSPSPSFTASPSPSFTASPSNTRRPSSTPSPAESSNLGPGGGETFPSQESVTAIAQVASASPILNLPTETPTQTISPSPSPSASSSPESGLVGIPNTITLAPTQTFSPTPTLSPTLTASPLPPSPSGTPSLTASPTLAEVLPPRFNTPQNPYSPYAPIRLSGRGPAGMQVRLSLGGEVLGEATINAAGEWEFLWERGIDSGAIEAQTLAPDGRLSTTARASIAIDLTAPSISRPRTGQTLLPNTRLRLEGQAPALAPLVLVVDGTTPLANIRADESGAWALDYILAEEGVYDLQVQIQDAAGLTLASSNRLRVTVAEGLAPQTGGTLSDDPEGLNQRYLALLALLLLAGGSASWVLGRLLWLRIGT